MTLQIWYKFHVLKSINCIILCPNWSSYTGSLNYIFSPFVLCTCTFFTLLVYPKCFTPSSHHRGVDRHLAWLYRLPENHPDFFTCFFVNIFIYHHLPSTVLLLFSVPPSSFALFRTHDATTVINTFLKWWETLQRLPLYC